MEDQWFRLAFLIINGVFGLLMWQQRKGAARIDVRLAEIEADREETRGDAATTTGVITLATTLAQMFEPMRKAVENLASVVTQSVTINEALMQRADEMHLVVEQRNLAAQQDRETSTTRYEAMVAQQDHIHADVKSGPAQTVRLLSQEFVKQTETVRLAVETASESHQDVIREAVSSALKPMLVLIEEKLDQMPGAEVSRQMIRTEIGSLQQQLVEQVSGQISPLFDKLEDIAAALDKLQPSPIESKEVGDQTPADTSLKGETNHVGNST